MGPLRYCRAMQWIHAVLLGILEGITEFLPVSSTGHLILAEKLLALPPSGFAASFTIAIQCGAIFAVLALYGRTLLVSRTLLLRLFAAFLPTAFCGAILYGIVKAIFLQSTSIVLASMLAGGVVLLLFELFLLPKTSQPPTLSPDHGERESSSALELITYSQAIGIGLLQSFSMIPGVSRSAASIIGGLALGLPRRTAVEFSFILAVPTMIAATSLDLAKSGAAFTGNEWALLGVGAAAAFLAALAAIRWLLRFLQRHTFIPFAVYRILAAPVFWFLLL